MNAIRPNGLARGSDAAIAAMEHARSFRTGGKKECKEKARRLARAIAHSPPGSLTKRKIITAIGGLFDTARAPRSRRATRGGVMLNGLVGVGKMKNIKRARQRVGPVIFDRGAVRFTEPLTTVSSSTRKRRGSETELAIARAEYNLSRAEGVMGY